MRKITEYIKSNPLIILLVFTAILITTAMLKYKQPFIRVMPLYISLVINFLTSKINRFSPLIGGINSILYAGIYFFYKLYGSALHAVLISSTTQFITFIRWSKHPYGNSTVLKKMTKKQVILTIFSIIVSLCVLCPLLSLTDTPQSVLDSAVTVISTFCSVLCMLSYAEYTKLMLLSSAMTLLLYISMVYQGDYEQVAYLIFSVYSLICITKSVFSAKKLLKEQSANS